MTYDGSINLNTKIDSSGVNSGVASIKSSLNGLKSVLTSVAGAMGIAFGIGKLVEFGAACVDAGAEAKAAKAQFSQVFGSLKDEAGESLETIAGQAGSTASAMRGCYNQIAAFAKTTGMSTEDALGLTNRALTAAADSAAFYDRSLSDVTDNLQSFLKGNYENDAALGLSCTETTRNAAANALYGKSFKDLSEAQKQLTLLQMVEDANKLSGAMGQAAREAGSWTSQTQLLKDQFKELMSVLGTGLIAVLTPALQFLNTLMGVLIRFANTLGTVLVNLFGIQFEDMEPVVETIDQAAESTDSLADATEDAADAAGDLAGATGDAADATGDLADATKEAAEAQKSLLGFDQITKLTEATSSGSGSGGSGGSGGDSGGGADSGTGSGLGDTASAIPAATDNVLNQTESALGEWAKRIKDLLDGIWGTFGDLLDHLANLIDALPEIKLPDIALPDLTFSPDWGKEVERQVQKVMEDVQNQAENASFDIHITNNFALIQQQLTDLDVVVRNTTVSVTEMGGGFENAWDKFKRWLNGLPVLGPLLGVVAANFRLLGDVMKPLTDLIDNNFNSLKFFISGLDDLVKGDWKQALQDFQTSWDYLKNNSLLQMAIELVKSGWKTIEKWIGKIPDLSQGIKLVKSGWTIIAKWIGKIPGLSQAIKLIKSGWSTVKNWVGTIPVVSQAVKLAKSGWSTVKSWVGTMPVLSAGIKLVKSGWTTVKSWLGDLSAKFNIQLPKVSVTWSGSPIKLPKFSVKWNAQGGILNGAQIFGMAGNTLLGGGEAGREAVLPLDRNTGWMDTLAGKIASQVGGSGQPITVNVTLDGRVVATSTINYINRQAKATGVNPLSAYL